MGAKLDPVRSTDPSPPDKEGQRDRETEREEIQKIQKSRLDLGWEQS